jgi:hypothetical protein
VVVTSRERPSSRQLLRELSRGQTISEEEGIRLLSPSYRKVIGEITGNIEDVCSTDAEGDYRTYWITGGSGNGKSQALRQVFHDLPGARTRALRSHNPDADKTPSRKYKSGSLKDKAAWSSAACQASLKAADSHLLSLHPRCCTVAAQGLY